MKRIRERDLEGIDLSSWRVAGCGAEPIRPETLEAFVHAFGKVGFRKEALLPSYGMAEASLAVAFTELGEGVKTLSVHGPTLWSENRAKPVADDDEDAVRLVSCGRAFPDHADRHLRPRRRDQRDPSPRAQGGRNPHLRPERDEGLLGRRRADARHVRRRLHEDR